MPHFENTDELYMYTRAKTKTIDYRRFIPLHDIVRNFAPLLCQSLSAIHALTGCESGSSYYCIGKLSVHKLAVHQNVDNLLKDLPDIGKSPLSSAATDKAKNFTARLYDPAGKYRRNSTSTSLNTLRFNMGTKKD